MRESHSKTFELNHEIVNLLLWKMAFHQTTGVTAGVGWGGLAELGCLGAAGMKCTPSGRVDGVGVSDAEMRLRQPFSGLGGQDRGQKGLGVRVSRALEQI